MVSQSSILLIMALSAVAINARPLVARAPGDPPVGFANGASDLANAQTGAATEVIDSKVKAGVDLVNCVRKNLSPEAIANPAAPLDTKLVSECQKIITGGSPASQGGSDIPPPPPPPPAPQGGSDIPPPPPTP